jgi:hypothetical protein
MMPVSNSKDHLASFGLDLDVAANLSVVHFDPRDSLDTLAPVVPGEQFQRREIVGINDGQIVAIQGVNCLDSDELARKVDGADGQDEFAWTVDRQEQG